MGEEAKLTECTSTFLSLKDGKVVDNEVAGVKCYTHDGMIQCALVPHNCIIDCSNNGEIRLVGGDSSTVGTVEMCYHNTWRLISDQDWNDNDAKVVCRQLGYNTEGTIRR